MIYPNHNFRAVEEAIKNVSSRRHPFFAGPRLPPQKGYIAGSRVRTHLAHL